MREVGFYLPTYSWNIRSIDFSFPSIAIQKKGSTSVELFWLKVELYWLKKIQGFSLKEKRQMVVVLAQTIRSFLLFLYCKKGFGENLAG